MKHWFSLCKQLNPFSFLLHMGLWMTSSDHMTRTNHYYSTMVMCFRTLKDISLHSIQSCYVYHNQRLIWQQCLMETLSTGILSKGHHSGSLLLIDFRTFPILENNDQYHTMPSLDMVISQPINTIVSYSVERKEEDMFKFGDPLNFYPIPKDRRLD